MDFTRAENVFSLTQRTVPYVFGYLSNWYPSPFDLDGVRYSSTEQYIMYQKCLLFGDTASAKAVLATDDAKAQRAIGRKAKGYIGDVWAGQRQLVAVR